MPGESLNVLPRRSSCRGCSAPAEIDDRFCGNCGLPTGLAPAASAPQQGAPVPVARQQPGRGPDIGEMTRLAGTAGQTHLAAMLSTSARMCAACGADYTQDESCAQCGSARDLLAMPPQDPIGLLYEYRSMLRKRRAMRIGTSETGPLFLLHDGKIEQRDPGSLKPVPIPLAPDSGEWLSPAAAVLRLALAAGSREVNLPWASQTLFDHAFGHARSHPGAGRRLALDAVRLGHVDLVVHCGLGESEQSWLRLIAAARRGDVPDVVEAAVALPVDRYRQKVAVLAVFAGQLRRVRGAAERLAPALAAFAPSEPLACLVQRAVGIVACTPAQRRADVVLLAGLVDAPPPLLALASAALTEIQPEDARLLGARGRVAAVHGSPRAVEELVVGSDLDAAPLAVVDGLVDAGVLTSHQIRALRREPGELVYLLARTSPEELTDDQVVQVDHADERVRRAHERGVADAGEQAPQSAMSRHLHVLDDLTHNRLDDVRLGDVLPEHADTAGRLATGLRRAGESGDPIDALDEVVLADRTTWQPLANVLGAGAGAVVRGEAVRRRFPAFADWLSLVAARERLFVADWTGAAQEARDCLAHATDEAVRDEAHNLLACALHHLGQHGAALAELETAIEGEYSVSLLANIAVVAAHLDRELAARHLSRVVREAPSQVMRANAAMRALRMWQGDGSKNWEGEDLAADKLPSMLREPLRTIITQPIGLDEFREVAGVLARFDAEWLRAPQSLAASPHRDSLEASFYRARASEQMYTAIVDVLATVTDWDSAPEWIRQERDDLVQQTKEYLLEHIDDPDNVAGVVALALAQRLHGVSRFDQVCLLLLGVATLTYHVTHREEEIANSLVDAYTAATRSAPGLPAEDQEKVSSLLDLAQRRIAFNLYKARSREVQERIDNYNAALDLLDRAQMGSNAWFLARHEVAETVEMCTRVRDQLTPWLRAANHEDVRSLLMDLLDHVRELETKARRVLGN